MAKIGKMIACVIGSMTEDGQLGANAEIIYRDFEDGLRGGVYAELERLQTIYLWCCLCHAGVQSDNPNRPRFLSTVNDHLWYVVQGKSEFDPNDKRNHWPIIDEIKKEFEKLTPNQQFEFLD